MFIRDGWSWLWQKLGTRTRDMDPRASTQVSHSDPPASGCVLCGLTNRILPSREFCPATLFDIFRRRTRVNPIVSWPRGIELLHRPSLTQLSSFIAELVMGDRLLLLFCLVVSPVLFYLLRWTYSAPLAQCYMPLYFYSLYPNSVQITLTPI